MEPKLVTDPSLASILDELKKREPIFHRPELGTARADYEAMTDPEFWEVGASGRRYAREFCIDDLVKRNAQPHEDVWEAKDFHCMRISDNGYLLTYTLVQDRSRVTRRSTIWRRQDGDWKILYHQGTIVEDADGDDGNS